MKGEHMRVFVLGESGTGKTTLSHQIVSCAAEFGVRSRHVRASAWVHVQLPHGSPHRTTLMSCATLDRLRADPGVSSRYLHTACEETIASGFVPIVDGVRNPADMVALFDPRTDYAVRITGGSAHSGFELHGLRAVDEYLRFLLATQIADYSKIIYCEAPFPARSMWAKSFVETIDWPLSTRAMAG